MVPEQDGLAASRDADPETRAKMEVRDWIEQCLDSLQTQKDAIEAELEVIRSKQKKSSKGKTEREEELDTYRERHNYHVQRLELMLRLLDNDNLSADQIKDVQEDVNYYIDSNQEPDFQVLVVAPLSLHVPTCAAGDAGIHAHCKGHSCCPDVPCHVRGSCAPCAVRARAVVGGTACRRKAVCGAEWRVD